MSDPLDSQIRVSIGGEKLRADLRLAPGLDTEPLTLDVLRGMLIERGVRPTYIDDDKISDLIECYDPAAEEPVEDTVAEGKPPVHGIDARLEWDPEVQEQLDAIKHARDSARARERGEQAEPSARIDSPAGDTTDSVVSHYERSAYCTVEAEQRLGRVVPAQEGEDGVNLFGEAVPSKVPATQVLKHDRSITIDQDGVIRAAVSGVLHADQDPVKIDTDLRIDGFIDFSTGNLVGFKGNVEVVKGVKDNFRVDIVGTLTVGELVEAASIKTGGSLVLRRGMAGREKGSIEVGMDAEAKFIDGVTGSVVRDMTIGSELSNARLRIGRHLLIPRGAIIGGRIEVLGRCEAGQIGSPSLSPQQIILGHHAEAEELAERVSEIIPKVQRARERVQQQYNQLTESTTDPSPAQAEQVTALQMQLNSHNEKLEPLAGGLRTLTQSIAARTSPCLIAHKVIHAGVTAHIGAWRVSFTQDIKGPVKLDLDDTGAARLTETGTGRPVALDTVADVHRSDVFPNMKELRSVCDGVLGPESAGGLDDDSALAA